MDNTDRPIGPDARVLDLVATHPATQDVFKSWDGRAGECIMCRALFESVGVVAERYGLDARALLADLNAAVAESNEH